MLSPQRYVGDAFIGQRGSWNCNPRSGYKVIFVPFADGYPSGMPEDILIGFVNANSNALGRPVGATVNWPVRCSWLTTSAVLSGA
jgi:glucose/arabinose dehydrogenase